MAALQQGQGNYQKTKNEAVRRALLKNLLLPTVSGEKLVRNPFRQLAKELSRSSEQFTAEDFLGAKVIEHNAMLVSQANDQKVSAFSDILGQLREAKTRSRFYHDQPNRAFELSRIFMVSGNGEEVAAGSRNG